MLAPREEDDRFAAWNRRWGAPYGRRAARPRGLARFLRTHDEFDERGMFGFQNNSDTRAFEYPWAYFAADPSRGQRILEIGGGLSGFQFAVAKSGAEVVNVDPGMEKLGWPVSHEFFEKANRKFGTRVELLKSTVADAPLPGRSFDTAISISVVEHIPPPELPRTMQAIERLLKPGARLIMTVDLFLDLEPFSNRKANQFGTNVSICDLVRHSGLELVGGSKAELHGFPEFDPKAILANLSRYRRGVLYPLLVQCLILRKPGPGSAAESDAAS